MANAQGQCNLSLILENKTEKVTDDTSGPSFLYMKDSIFINKLKNRN